jgi:hypothetical protein
MAMWLEWLARIMKDPATAGLGSAELPLRGAADLPGPAEGRARPEAERPLLDLADAPATG